MRRSLNLTRQDRNLHSAGKTTGASISSSDGEQMAKRAKQASELLRTLSHEPRLLILCFLCAGEKSVTDLEELLSLRQSSVSQHIARLRLDGLVQTKRSGKAAHYRLANDEARKIVETLYEIFCNGPKCRAR